MDFWNKFNDYSCVESRDTNVSELYHFTDTVDAVRNIVTGCFWATDIRDFKGNGEDQNEGYLILHQILNLIHDIDSSRANIVKEYIGTEDKMNIFFDNHETYVVSTSVSSCSKHMWDNYAKNEGYQIVFDKTELINSLYIVLKNGRIRKDKDIFKHAQILCNYQKQVDIIKKEYRGMIENQEKFLNTKENLDYILQHLMYYFGC